MVVRNDIDNTSTVLSVTITREVLKPRLDSELKKFRQKAPIKGFRPGQAPVEFIKKVYGPSIFSDSLNELLTDELYEYLKESKIQVLGQPLPLDDQEKFAFKISNPDPEYTVKYEIGFVPDFELKGVSKESTYERLTISDLTDLAEKDLEYARKRMGQRSEPEDNILENDIIKIESTELDGDEPKAGGWETTITILVSSIKDEQFKTQILFLKKGDSIRFNARSLEDHPKDEMYRKYILNLPEDDGREVGDMFVGVIESVNRVQDAELNEDFYTGYFGKNMDSREEAIEETGKGIQKFYDSRADALLMRSFQERLMAENRFELPETFIKRWLKLTNKDTISDSQLELELPFFLENLRWTLIRDRIKAVLNVEATQEDILNHFADRIMGYFQGQVDRKFALEFAETMMKKEDDVKKATDDIEWEKLTHAIRNEVTIVDKAIPSEEFHKIVEEVSAKAKGEQEENETGLTLG